MEWIAAIATVVTSIVVPFIVNLLNTADVSANRKRWVAIVVSIIAGVFAGILSGAPTPETFVTWVLACVGGTQTAYSLFKSIGVTSKLLDAVESVGTASASSKASTKASTKK